MKLTAPKAGENVSLLVAVRVRPVLKSEQPKTRDAQPKKDILRVIDKRMVLVMDPEDPEEKDYLDQVQNRSKEKKYTFDVAFGAECTNSKLYKATIAPLIKHVISGHNCTVFAYGATGSGKTYTMVGSNADSGLMVRSMESLFAQSAQLRKDEDVTITASYLEVYNEVLYDLLVPNSAELPLREDPVLGAVPSGLTFAQVSSANDILHLLETGNARRKTERTDANTQSSRSHAVLEVHLKRQGRNHYKSRQLHGKLALVDLAGSERAAETNNFGQKLRDGANINRSLLSLANCINQLGKAGASGGRAYIPYRNSKLTRLLKDGLSGNSRTVMIATVAASADQYHHSINTLKYANRAKDIKTHIVQNVGSVESHISDYRRIIDNLQGEVRHLKEQLAIQEESRSPSIAGTDMNMSSMHPEGVSLFDTLVSSIHNNVAERINLQKALFEVQDADVRTRMQLEALQETLKRNSLDSQGSRADVSVETEELAQRIKDNESEIALLRGAIEANEVAQQSVQARIDGTIEGQGSRNPQLLKMLKQFRLQALQLVELEFQMAVRDQIIDEQRTVVGNLWKVLGELAPSDRISDIACELGIEVDTAVEGNVQVPSFASGCIAAVAAAAAAVTTGSTASRPSMNTLQATSSARPSLAPGASTHRNTTSSAAPSSSATALTSGVGPASSSRSPECVAASGPHDSAPIAASRSLPARRSRDADSGPLEDGADVPGLLTSLSMGVQGSGSPLFPGATLNSSIPEDSVPAMDCIGISGGRNKTPTAWEEPLDVTSGQSAKTQDSNADVSGTSKPVGKVDGPRADTRSSGAGMLPSIGVQGMRVLSSLKVAGWNLAGGGGARSAHVVKEDKDLHHKEVAGTSGQALEQGRSSPIRGWGALEDISSQSQSPVRACDRDAPQATRSILDGLSGKGPVGMHAACASVDTDGDDGRMTPTDADGKCAGTSKARGSSSTRASLGMRLLGSLRSARPSRRNSMGGHSSTDGPPRTASGGGELEGGGVRGGLGDDETRGSGQVSRESDRVMPFIKQDSDIQQQPDGQRSGGPVDQHEEVATEKLGVVNTAKEFVPISDLPASRLQGTSAEAPCVMHAWTGPANTMMTWTDKKPAGGKVPEAGRASVAAAAAAAAAAARTDESQPNACADTDVASGTANLEARGTGEVWEGGFTERRRVVGGSVAVPANTAAPASGPQNAAASTGGAAAGMSLGLAEAGFAGVVSKGLGGLAGGSLGSMAPGERLKRLKSHRDRGSRAAIEKKVSVAKLKGFAMEVVGGGVQGGFGKIKP